MKWRIALTSMMTMVVAMGMGRFALTPQMPHMLEESQINLTQASLLAAINFLGYLLGAVEAMHARGLLALRFRIGLWASGIILLASAFIPYGDTGVAMNFILRFLAGIASAWVVVMLSTWVQQQLAQEHTLRTIAFSGAGVGIMLTGLVSLGLDYCHSSAAFNWFVFGVIALAMSFFIHPHLPHSFSETSKEEAFTLTPDARSLVISYALCGMGYVLPATFLSKLAVDEFPGSIWADAFWPIFGGAVVIGMALLAAHRDIKKPQQWLAVIFFLQSIGILACTLMHGLMGLLIGALLVGGTFMVILQLTMRLGSELAPHHIRHMMGLLTTAFAVGQLSGPVLSALSTHCWGSMKPALLVATIGSLFSIWLAFRIKSPKVL